MKKLSSLLLGVFVLVLLAGCCKEKPRACMLLGWNTSDTIIVNHSVSFMHCWDLALLCKPVPDNTPCYWDFGDGTSAIGTYSSSVQHAYSVPGTYIVTLTVPNGKPEKDSKTITVTTPPSGPDYVGTYNTNKFCTLNDTTSAYVSYITSSAADKITIHNLLKDSASIDFSVSGFSIVAPPLSWMTDSIRGSFNAGHNFLDISFRTPDTTTTFAGACGIWLRRQ